MFTYFTRMCENNSGQQKCEKADWASLLAEGCFFVFLLEESPQRGNPQDLQACPELFD